MIHTYLYVQQYIPRTFFYTLQNYLLDIHTYTGNRGLPSSVRVLKVQSYSLKVNPKYCEIVKSARRGHKNVLQLMFINVWHFVLPSWLAWSDSAWPRANCLRGACNAPLGLLCLCPHPDAVKWL